MALKAFKERVRERQAVTYSSNLPEGFPRKLSMERDYPYFVSILHSLELGMPVSFHSLKSGEGWKSSLCNEKFYQEEEGSCEHCHSGDKEKSRINKELLVLIYAHNLDDSPRFVEKPSDEVDKFRVLGIRGGKGETNFRELNDAERTGDIQKIVWQFGKEGEKKNTSYWAATEVTERKLGANFDKTIPEHIMEFIVPPKGVPMDAFVACLALASFDNLRCDLLEIPEPEEMAKLIAAKPKASHKASDKL